MDNNSTLKKLGRLLLKAGNIPSAEVVYEELAKRQVDYDNGTQDVEPRQGPGLPPYSGEPRGARYHQNTDADASPGKPGKTGPGHPVDYILRPGNKEFEAHIDPTGALAPLSIHRQLDYWQQMLDNSNNPYDKALFQERVAYFSEMKLRGFA